MPNSWSPIDDRDEVRSVAPAPLLTAALRRVGGVIVVHAAPLLQAERFGQRGQQGVTVELRDIVVEADLAAAIEILGRRVRRQGDDRRVLPARRAAHRLGELEAVHARHLDVADDDVEILAGFAQAERAIGRFDAW